MIDFARHGDTVLKVRGRAMNVHQDFPILVMRQLFLDLAGETGIEKL
jgi:hypothetical protein